MENNSDNIQETHSLISVYGKTTENNFPIILIIGREPNSAALMNEKIGNYDLQKYKRCKFWNSSYGVIGSFVKKTCKQFKDEAINRESSCIAFSDISYKGILFKENKKMLKKSRKSLDIEEQKKHINTIYNHTFTKDRVKFIIFSGIENGDFNNEIIEYIFKNCPHPYISFKKTLSSFSTKLNFFIDELKDNNDIILEIIENWRSTR